MCKYGAITLLIDTDVNFCKIGELSAVVDKNGSKVIAIDCKKESGSLKTSKDRKVTVCVGKFNTEIDAHRAHSKVSSQRNVVNSLRL